jgi:hypothetical protein
MCELSWLSNTKPYLFVTPYNSGNVCTRLRLSFSLPFGAVNMSDTYINVHSCFYTSVALLTLAVLAVFVRVTLRANSSRKSRVFIWSQHLDELFCLLALLPTTGVSVVLIYGM